jgi:hypothetical protein
MNSSVIEGFKISRHTKTSHRNSSIIHYDINPIRMLTLQEISKLVDTSKTTDIERPKLNSGVATVLGEDLCFFELWVAVQRLDRLGPTFC